MFLKRGAVLLFNEHYFSVKKKTSSSSSSSTECVHDLNLQFVKLFYLLDKCCSAPTIKYQC